MGGRGAGASVISGFPVSIAVESGTYIEQHLHISLCIEVSSRHRERSEAIQNASEETVLDCFVALFLAMTAGRLIAPRPEYHPTAPTSNSSPS